MYDRDDVNRQIPPVDAKATYEDHRKAIGTATVMFRMKTQHDIAMCILTNRFFEAYRNKAFQGLGGFTKDYSFLLKKIGMVHDFQKETVPTLSISAKLATFTTPTVVQINHIVGSVEPVNLPDALALTEWAKALNSSANESTSYRVVGLELAA